MPYKRRYRKKSKREYKRKPRRRYKASPTLGLMSNKFVQRHRYVERININPVSGGVGTYTFGANCMYDPDITSTGHQPMLFDNLMSIYHHCTVIGSKIKATFMSGSDTTYAGCGIGGIELSGQPGAISDFNQLLEQAKRVKHGTFGSATSGTNRLIVTQGFSSKKFFTQNSLDEDDLANTASANPAERAYFHVFVAPTGTDVDVPSTDVIIEIDYVCVWHEPKTIEGS